MAEGARDVPIVLAPCGHCSAGRELGHGRPRLGGQVAEPLDEREVLLDVPRLEAREPAPDVPLRKRAILGPVPADQPPGEHPVRRDTDAERARDRQDLETWGEVAKLDVVRNGTSDLRLWDGATFHLRKPWAEAAGAAVQPTRSSMRP